jgi:hypothetical protein
MNRVKEFSMRYDGKDLFVVADGLKIAKRGHPDTRHAKTWVSLEPGWAVRDCADGKIEIAYRKQERIVQ